MNGDLSSPPGLLHTLQNNRSFSKALVEGTPAGILVVDRDYRILDLNPRMEEWIGKPQDQVIGQKCHEVLFQSEEPCPLSPQSCPAMHTLDTSEPSPKILRTLQGEEGRRQELEIQAYPVLDESGDPLYALEFIQDVTSSVLLKKYQEEAALRDPLTGLYNRKAFHIFFERGLYRAHRQGHPFSLALIDFDSFKDFNEKQGDDAGDDLLQKMGKLLLMTTRREVDTVFRLEADRFALTLPETRHEQACQIGDRIRMVEVQKKFPMTFSMAICQAEEQENPSALFHRVGEELFQAKKSGGTRIL